MSVNIVPKMAARQLKLGNMPSFQMVFRCIVACAAIGYGQWVKMVKGYELEEE